jgi:hypothetical protein
MATTSLNISVIEKRMMNVSEAAHYSGLAIKHFKALCPVQPIALTATNLRYDKLDLDRWLDSLKTGSEMSSRNHVLAQL